MERLSKDGFFTVQLPKQREDILRAHVQSRHRTTVIYNLYLQYNSTKIQGWYCQCLSGGRVIGCCAHTGTVIWYLAFDRHASKRLRPRSNSYLETLNDAHDR